MSRTVRLLVPSTTAAVASVSFISFKQAHLSFALLHLHPPETLAATVLISIAAVPLIAASFLLTTTHLAHRGSAPYPWLHHMFHAAVTSWGIASVSVSGLCIALQPAHWKGIAITSASTAGLVGLVLLAMYPFVKAASIGMEQMLDRLEEQAYEMLKGDPM